MARRTDGGGALSSRSRRLQHECCAPIRLYRRETKLADLKDEFEQAAAASQAQPERPEDANHPIGKRLRELYREGTKGEPAGREAAMRQYIGFVGDLGGAKG